jgi:hypothetical protein
VPTTFDGQDAFLAALRQLFAGIEAEEQQMWPHDPNNAVQGTEIGLWLGTENWLDLSPKPFLSVDASYRIAFQEYYALSRLGFRVPPRLASAFEGGSAMKSIGMAVFARLNLRAPSSPCRAGLPAIIYKIF